jgi:tetratricopeptide (TPR) repeat protein
MPSVGDWDELIGKAEAEHFVGREQELESFRQQIGLTKPRYLIFYITGQGGAGKTTLLNRYREIVARFGFLVADCDELQRDVPAVLGRFAHQLAEQGFRLKDFEERYTTYRQRMHEIQNDPEAPQGLAALLGRTLVRSAFVVGDIVPGLRKGLDVLPQESLETQVSEWAAYLAKKLANKDEVALVRDPVPILTPLFFEDLNKVAQTRKVLLCFDNFEAARPELWEWLLRLREYKPSLNVRLAIAGRDQSGTKWDPLRSVTQTNRVDVFTEREAEAFLDVYTITNANRRREILELSGRLPVLMSWLAAVEGGEAETLLPTHDIVERFLRWVTEPALRQVALLAAIPRTFNADVLKPLLEQLGNAVDEQSVFDWLQTMPFVKQRSEGWHYHDVVRRMMLHYQRRKSPQTYRRTHAALANFYNTYRDELRLSEEEQWINEAWRKYTLSHLYHFLVADPSKHWGEVMSLFVVAMRKRRTFAFEIIEMLNLEDVHDELSSEQNVMIQLFHQQLQAIEQDGLKNGFEMFDKLCGMVGLSSQAKGYALAERGDCHRWERKWEKALSDFEEALRYIPEDALVIASCGVTYRLMGRLQDALANLNHAITLDEKFAWAINNRGVVYAQLGRYQDALADLDHSITLNEKATWSFANRGWVYLRMRRYQESLADFDHAIALNTKFVWAIIRRGWLYSRMEHYREALADFDQAIALDDKNSSSFIQRGATYHLIGHYREALADFDRAIALDNTNAWIFANRGVTYSSIGYYQEALADFDRAIALDEKYDWAFLRRGMTCRLIGRYQEALADFNRAIALNEKADWYRYCRAQLHFLTGQMNAFESDLHAAIELAQTFLRNTPNNCHIGFNLAFYNLVAGNLNDAELLYARLTSTCSSWPNLQGAVEGLTDFLTMQPSNEIAQSIRTQLQTRIAELKRSFFG